MQPDLVFIGKRHRASHGSEECHCANFCTHLGVQAQKVFVVCGVPAAVSATVLYQLDLCLVHLGFNLGKLERLCRWLSTFIVTLHTWS